MKIAAIDIGSNACRLLINEVQYYDDQQVDFIKTNLIRIPLRLGVDVFKNGKISPLKYKMFEETMHAYAHIMNAYDVKFYKAYATSAMRDAENGTQIAQKILKNTGIDIEIIDGIKEASLLNSQIIDRMNSTAQTQIILIDVGGGSTEITSYINKIVTHQRSFNIGTLRLLNNQVSQADWTRLKQYCTRILDEKFKVNLIGTGGNINKVFSMSKLKDSSALKLKNIKTFYEKLKDYTVAERMHHFNMKEDRADVIVPAMQIYLTIMESMQKDEIFVPKIGLADGIIREIYHESII